MKVENENKEVKENGEGKQRVLGNVLLVQERNKYIQLQILHLNEIMI